MFYVYDPTGPLDTLVDLDESSQDEGSVTYLAKAHPECIYFEFVPEPTIREVALQAAREFIDTISDETQAVDLAWSDMITTVESLFNPAMQRRVR